MAGKRGPDKKPRKERPSKRGLILHSAMNVFSYYGYDGASFDKIAAEAGVVKSLVIKYFGTKENVAVLCIRQFIELFTRKISLVDKRDLPYEEHVERMAALFKRYQKELRFIVALTVTPAHEHLANEIWQSLFDDKLSILDPYRQSFNHSQFNDMVYVMASMHFFYVVSGREQSYDRSLALLTQALPNYLRENGK